MKVKISTKIIGVFIILIVFAMILILFFSSEDESTKLECLRQGKDLGIAFLGAVATKNLRNLITIIRGKKSEPKSRINNRKSSA